ncbi:NAD-specific glutamate dehydrogenase [Aphis craccivora]|uniref:NAD-specific glutamate dehydrogenase n=1 Tax=Aphis craccivora TaxID=307492 RepID=A0A6G0VHJ6_APHCR|nr:NAD-specific glutamate dehydrogenase [Aphis craccivora]
MYVFFAFPLELVGQMSHQPVVEIFAAQVRVARRRLHFEYRTLVDLQNGHVERSAAQIEYQHVPLSFQVLVQTVRQSRGCRFVDYSHHVQTGYDARVLCRLSLRIVKVRRHRDHGVRHFTAQVRFGGLLHFRQHHRTDFFRSEHFPFAFELHLDLWLPAVVHHFERPVFDVGLCLFVVETTSDQTLGVEHCVHGVHRHLVLGRVADQPFGVGERHITRGGPVTLIVGDYFYFSVLPDTHARIGGTQVDTDRRLPDHIFVENLYRFISRTINTNRNYKII